MSTASPVFSISRTFAGVLAAGLVVVLAPSAQAAQGTPNDYPANLPKAALGYKIFRLPASSPRNLTHAELDNIADYFGEAPFGPMVNASRRFGGSDMVAVPGQYGFAIVNIASPLPQGYGATSDGIRYRTKSEAGYMLSGDEGCHDWQTVGECPATSDQADQLYLNFMLLLPDFVKRQRIFGIEDAPVDGLIWGSFPEEPGIDWGTLTAQITPSFKAWDAKAKKRARAKAASNADQVTRPQASR